MIAPRVILVAVALFSASFDLAANSQSSEQMQKAVAKLVHAAEKMNTLWPWKPAIPEVAKVVAYGRAVAPLLVVNLADDPDNDTDVDWHVQQQIALALCRIYGVSEEPGHIYMNRVMPSVNARIKAFWVAKMAEP